MDADLALKAVGSIEALMQAEVVSGRADRFANVQRLAQHAQAIDRMSKLRVADFEAGGMGDPNGMLGNGVVGYGGMGIPRIGGFPGDVGDNQRQILMAVTAAMGDMREKDRSVARSNLSSETLDLVKLKADLPADHPQAALLAARIENNIASLAAPPISDELKKKIDAATAPAAIQAMPPNGDPRLLPDVPDLMLGAAEVVGALNPA